MNGCAYDCHDKGIGQKVKDKHLDNQASAEWGFSKTQSDQTEVIMMFQKLPEHQINMRSHQSFQITNLIFSLKAKFSEERFNEGILENILTNKIRNLMVGLLPNTLFPTLPLIYSYVFVCLGSIP